MGVDTKNLKVGGPVFGSFGQYGVIDVKAGTVTKVSPTGQITADFNEVFGGNGKPRIRRFTNTGWEIGGWRSETVHLIDEATFARLAERQRAQAANRKIGEFLRAWSYRNKAELNALLAKLIELVALVPDDESTVTAQGGVTPAGDETGTGSVDEGDSTRSPSGDAPEPFQTPDIPEAS